MIYGYFFYLISPTCGQRFPSIWLSTANNNPIWSCRPSLPQWEQHEEQRTDRVFLEPLLWFRFHRYLPFAVPSKWSKPV